MWLKRSRTCGIKSTGDESLYTNQELSHTQKKHLDVVPEIVPGAEFFLGEAGGVARESPIDDSTVEVSGESHDSHMIV